MLHLFKLLVNLSQYLNKQLGCLGKVYILTVTIKAREVIHP